MNRVVRWPIAICLLTSAAPSLGDAASVSAVECKSAARNPNVPYSQYAKMYREACIPGARARATGSGVRALALTDDSVHGHRQTLANVSFADVPQWSDADIIEQFVATRDARYMYANDRPDFPRRISWLYPEDGCYARAEQVIARAFDAGKTKPYKLWAFGPLRAHTSNTPSGVVPWLWHVVPVVKNGAGEAIVLDAATSPCRPLPWKTWLAMMVDDMKVYDEANDWNGVAVSDFNAYMPGDPVMNDIDGPKHRDLSLSDEQNEFLLDNLFGSPREWGRQVELGRDPYAVLGDTPPWSGSSCLFTEVVHQTLDMAPNSSASAIASCPFATLGVGGGFLSSSSSFLISKNMRNGNGWEIAARNVGPSTQSLVASAVCLTGAPTNASVITVTGTGASIANNGYGSATATCSSGVLVGGGFSTAIAGQPSSIVKVYSHGRTASTGNTWQVSAYNTTGSNRSITPYAYCLNNTNYWVSQTAGSLSSDGIAAADCPAPLRTLGGGFAFARTSAYALMTMSNEGSAYAVDMQPPPTSTDPNAKAYAQCLAEAAPPTVCTEASAADLGAQNSTTTVRGDGCVKIAQYPGNWVRSVTLQARGNGSGYPIPYTWTNCSSAGSGILTGDWRESSVMPVSSACTAVIDLAGSSESTVSLAWWASG